MDGSAAKSPSFSLCIALVLCFDVGCGGQTGSEKEVPSSTPRLQTVEVLQIAKAQDERRTVVFFGKLIAEKSAALRYSISGKVDRVEAAVGDRKKQGAILAVIAQPELNTEKAKLDGQVRQLQDSVNQSPPSQRARIQEQIAGLQAQQQQLDTQLNNGILTVPFDCIVRTVRIEAGKPASPVVAAFDVVADRQPVVVCNLPPDVSPQLSPDQSIWVAIADKAFKCRMREPTDDSANVVVEFTEPLSSEYWLFDDVVEARFVLKTESEGHWLPIGALRRDASDRWNVLAAEWDAANESDGVLLEVRSVNVLRTKVDSVLVDGAINAGDFIVSAGGHRVVAGQRVVVSPVSDAVVTPAGADL